MSGTWKNIRMQFATTPWTLGVPAIVLGGAFLVNLLVAAALPVPGPYYSGAANAPVWYFLVLGIMALNSYFPFAMSLSSTRQSFALGCLSMAAIGGLFLGTLMVLGGLLERATGGFWVEAYMFYSPWVWNYGALSAFLFFGLMTVLLYSVGFLVGAVSRRFGTAILTVGITVVAAILVLLVWLAARTWGWPAIGEWLGTLGGLQAAGLSVPAIVILALAGYGILRHVSVR